VKSTPWEWRRAERYNQLLDLAAGRRNHHRRRRSDLDVELAPLVATAKRVEALPLVAKSEPSFRASLRAQLVQEAELIARAREARTGAPEEKAAMQVVRLGSRVPAARGVAPRQRSHPRTRTRAAILAGVTAGALALSGVSAASNGALPGNVLYPFKRSAERAQLALAGSDLSRGQLYLEFAQTRMSEANTVVVALVPGVLDDFDAEAKQGAALLQSAATDHHSTVALDKIDKFVDDELSALLKLGARAGVDGWRVQQSIAGIADIRQSAKQTRTTLS
jgi:hypothetical protein